MKHLLTSKWFKPAAAALLAVVIGFSALGLAAAPALAQTSSATSQPAVPNATRVANLEKAFTRENTWLTTQANNLQKADSLITTAQALIDKAKSKGWAVGELQAALDAFKAQIADAQKSHNTAAGILSSHLGFDASGNVTDVSAATQTVRDARQSLEDGHVMLVQAVTDLRMAVRNYRSEHKAKNNPSAAPTVAPSGSAS